MTELDEVVRERRATRLFLRDKPVPRELLDEALSLAMRAPSNSNIQPWRVFLASGPRATGWSRRFSRRQPPGSRRPRVCRRAFYRCDESSAL